MEGLRGNPVSESEIDYEYIPRLNVFLTKNKRVRVHSVHNKKAVNIVLMPGVRSLLYTNCNDVIHIPVRKKDIDEFFSSLTWCFCNQCRFGLVQYLMERSTMTEEQERSLRNVPIDRQHNQHYNEYTAAVKTWHRGEIGWMPIKILN